MNDKSTAVLDRAPRFSSDIETFVRAEIGFALEERRPAAEAKRMVLEMVQREYPDAFVADFEISDTLEFAGWSLTVEHPPGHTQTIRMRR